MELRLIRFAAMVAEEKCVARAASRLDLPQAVLSRHLHELEDSLGVELFERKGDDVVLSAAGRSLLSEFSPLLRGWELMRDRNGSVAGSLRGNVVGGMPFFVARPMRDGLETRVAAAEPNITLQLFEDTHSALAEQWVARVESGRMDFCLGYWSQAPARLMLTPVAVEDLRVFAAPGQSLGEVVTLADLANQPLWLPARHGHLRGLLRAAARAAGVSLDMRSDVDDWRTVTGRVARGDGITVAPLALTSLEESAARLGAARIAQHGGGVPALGRMVSLLSRPPANTTDAAMFVAGVAHTLAVRLVRDGLWRALPEENSFRASAS